MIRRLAISLAVLLFGTLALQGAALQGIVAGRSTGGGGGGFQGILDIASGAKGCWGTIACSAATRGTAAIYLCDTAEANCSNAISDATTGIVSSTQTRNSVACGSTPGVDACKVQLVFDQSGANYCAGATPCVFEAVATNFLYFIPNAIGTIPALQCVGTASPGHFASINPFPSYSQPQSMVAAARVDVSTAGVYGSLMTAGTALGGGTTMGFANATIDAVINAGTTIIAPPAVSVGTFYAMIGTQQASGSTGTMSINGSTTTGTVGTAGDGGGTTMLRLCLDNTAAFGVAASFIQLAFYTSDVSSSIAAITSNMRTNGGY